MDAIGLAQDGCLLYHAKLFTHQPASLLFPSSFSITSRSRNQQSRLCLPGVAKLETILGKWTLGAPPVGLIVLCKEQPAFLTPSPSYGLIISILGIFLLVGRAVNAARHSSAHDEMIQKPAKPLEPRTIATAPPPFTNLNSCRNARSKMRACKKVI